MDFWQVVIMESINKALSPLLVVFNWYVLPVFSLGVRVTAALLWLFSSSGSDIFWDQGKKNELFAESFSQILIQPHNWVVQTVGLLHFWNVNVNMKFWFFKLFVFGTIQDKTSCSLWSFQSMQLLLYELQTFLFGWKHCHKNIHFPSVFIFFFTPW